MADTRLMMEACKRMGKCDCTLECRMVGGLNPVSEAPLLLEECEWPSMKVCPKGLTRCVKTAHCMGDCPETGIQFSGIGDVTSDAKGSGARYTAGKMPIELVPVALIADYEDRQFEGELTPNLDEVLDILRGLGQWQRGLLSANALLARMDDPWMDCAAVFAYGRKKYAAWNWAKGMPWSVPMACAVRHCLAILRGEENDPESGLPHRGHVACNLVMLAQFEMSYPEGDDRPAILRVSPVDNGDNAA